VLVLVLVLVLVWSLVVGLDVMRVGKGGFMLVRRSMGGVIAAEKGVGGSLEGWLKLLFVIPREEDLQVKGASWKRLKTVSGAQGETTQTAKTKLRMGRNEVLV
jgi:hypothetical protein